MKSVQFLMFLLGLSILIQSCGDINSASSHGELRTIRGQLSEVNSISLLEIKSITVQIETGDTFVIEAREKIFTGFTPAHLKEHMVQGTEVSVTFYEQDGHLVLKDIMD